MQKQNEPVYEIISGGLLWAVTQAEVNACQRVQTDLGEVFYTVSAGTPDRPKVAIVRWNAVLGRIACTCKDGISPTCWHRRAAKIVERQHRIAQK